MPFQVKAAEDFIMNELRRGLSPTLYYHGLHHTLDVVAVASDLAAAEGVTDTESLLLLRTAALYHDAGFLHAYQGHEVAGCELVRATLPGFGYLPAQVEQICAMIMATRYPQEPRTHLDQIMCDADLDYLGRADFDSISTSLYHELTALQLIDSEHAWLQLQASFLSHHCYWTATALAQRAAPKQARLDHILTLLENWPACPETVQKPKGLPPLRVR